MVITDTTEKNPTTSQLGDGIIKKVGRRTNVWDVACGSMNSKDKISFKHPNFSRKISKRPMDKLD